MKKFTFIISLVGVVLIAVPTLNAQVSTMENIDPCITCEQLMDLQLPDVTITSAERVNEGTPHCRVLGIIGREIKFELLLPDQWNARYIMGGGGGFSGSIQGVSLGRVNNGYATSGTNTGHEGNGLLADWALNNMERQLNFGHLAIHRTAEVSKAIIGNYYGNYPMYSYFIGCSRGGGQAMMEAQRYPNDFDGIVVRAPAFNWPAIAGEFIQNTQAVYPISLTDPILSPDNIRMLHDAVLNQCDMIDGVRDSILNDPSRCKFNFDLLPKCQDNIPGKGCFTIQQIEAIKTIYDGVDIGNGITYPGFPFGGENNGWQSWITGPNADAQKLGYPTLHAAFGIEMFKYLILQDPDWDYLTYDFTGYEKEMRYASAYLDATSTDYSEFKKHNGKIIFFHGWNDPALSAYATIDHYNAVKAIDPDIESYMRLYLLPGVLHCGGGDGPSGVGRIALIRDWVENGNPPDRIVVSKTENNEVVMTRPVYPYPRIAVYDGSGDPNDESNWIEE